MKHKNIIEINPETLVGKPIIKDTRIFIEFVSELSSYGWEMEQILQNYPQLKKEDIFASIEYSLEVLKEEKLFSI